MMSFTAWGLLLDIIGAVLLTWDLWVMSDYAILDSGTMRLGSTDNVEENRDMVSVQERLRQRRLAWWGFPMLLLGFLLQFIGALAGE